MTRPPMSIWMLFALTVLVHVGFSGLRVTMSLFALSLGATPLTVGVLMSLLAVIPMLFAVSWGRRIDRIGIRIPMLTGACVVIASLLLPVFHPRIESLYVMSAVGGAGFILFHICANQTAGLIGAAGDRVRNFSVLALAFSGAGIVGPMVSGFAIDGIGHRHTFLLLTAGPLAAVAILLFGRLNLPRSVEPREAAQHGVRDLLRIPAMRRVLLVSAVLSMAWDLFTFVMPIHGSQLGLSATTIGIILGCFGGAIFAVRLVLPAVARHLHPWQVLIAAMLITGVVLAAIPVVSDVALLIALAVVLGIGLGGAQPMIMSELYETAPPGRGAEAVGVRTVLLNASQTGIPLLFGALGAVLGMAPVFWSMAFALLAGSWYARPKKNRAA